MSGKPWTQKDNTALRRMYKTMMTTAEIAAELGRTCHSVSLHAPAIGLYREPDWRSKRAAFRRLAK